MGRTYCPKLRFHVASALFRCSRCDEVCERALGGKREEIGPLRLRESNGGAGPGEEEEGVFGACTS